MHSITSIDCSVSKLVYKKAITHTHKAEETQVTNTKWTGAVYKKEADNSSLKGNSTDMSVQTT